MSNAVSEYKLECYQIKMALGTRGNMWLVEDSVTGGRFVMRRLAESHEAVYRTLGKIRHSNLVEILDVFCCRGSLYVIEEYLDGQTLAKVLAEKGPSGALALSVTEQILEALCALHGNGIVHRDIKPDNIMMDSQGTIRLMDFDIARLFSEEKDADTTLKGTRVYAPPEQFGFHQTDHRADIYALGVTINELATGRLPEDGVCGGFLGSLVRRCTELDPKRRYQTAKQALAQFRRMKNRKRFLVLGAAAVLGLAVAVGIWMWQQPAGGKSGEIDNESLETVLGRLQTESGYSTFEDLAGPYRGDWGIRRGYDIEPYPSMFLDEDGDYGFVIEMEDGREVAVTMEKTPEQLVFSCALENMEPSVFCFNDSIFDDPRLDIPFGPETYSSGFDYKFEILSPDYDEDGDREFVILMGRCKWIEPPNPAFTYLYVGYSLVWFVDLTEEGTWICCQEPYMDEGTPTFAYDFMICDHYNPFEGYRWDHGKWTYVLDPYMSGDNR